MGAKLGKTPRTLAVYALGLGLLGLTIGLLLGMSKTSVVKDVITALFGLIAAGTLFYVPWSLGRAGGGSAPSVEAAAPPVDLVPLRAAALTAHGAQAAADKALAEASAALAAAEAENPQDPNKVAATKLAVDAARAEAAKRASETTSAGATLAAAETDVQQVAEARQTAATAALRGSYLAAGVGLAAFSFGIIVASLYGTLLRTSGSFEDLAPRQDVTIPVRFSPEEALNAVLLDRLLDRIGIASDARATVIARADACGPETNHLRRLTGKAKDLINAYGTSDPQAKTPETVDGLGNALGQLYLALEVTTAGKLPGAPAVTPPSEIRQRLREALDAFTNLQESGGTWLRDNPKIATLLQRWFARAAPRLACQNTTALYAEAVVQLKDLPNDVFKPENLGAEAPGFERLD